MNEIANTLPEVVVETPEDDVFELTPSGEIMTEDDLPDETPDPNAIRAEVEELKKERERIRAENKEARAKFFREQQRGVKPPPPPAEKPPELEPEPKVDDFDDYSDYAKALVAHEVKKARSEWDKQAVERDRNLEYQRKDSELYGKIQRGFEKYEDFREVALDESVPITPLIKEILFDCESPEDVAYYLGKNITDAIKISHMTPLAAAREIAKIELAIKEQKPPEKQITKAPPPIKTLGSKAKVQKDPTQMTQKEYEAWRKSQGAKPY
jgi:hypothetical protein